MRLIGIIGAQEFRNRIRAINSEAYIVAEIWHEAQRWLQGDHFDAVMNYEATKPVIAFFSNGNLDFRILHQQSNYRGIQQSMDAYEFANRIDHNLGLYHKDITYAQLNLIDSHDTPRFLSCVGGDKASLKLAWLYMFTYPGAPCIYYGDEIGMTGPDDPGCRAAFPWHAEETWDRNLLAFYQQATALRRLPTKIVFGPGTVKEVGMEVDELKGTKALSSRIETLSKPTSSTSYTKTLGPDA